MQRMLFILACAGLVVPLAGCESPHRMAEITALREQVKTRDKQIIELHDMLENGEDKYREDMRAHEKLVRKYEDLLGDMDELRRNHQLEVSRLEAAIEKATGKPFEKTEKPDATKSDAAQPSDAKQGDGKKSDEKTSNDKSE